MSWSLRTKIFLAIALIMALSAAVVMGFTRGDVKAALVDAEYRSALNVLHLLEVNVGGRYKSLLQGKVRAVRTSKAQLAALAGLVDTTFDRLTESVLEGRMSAGAARSEGLSWLRSLDPPADIRFMVFNDAGVVQASTDPAMEGRDISNLVDAKGRTLDQVVREEAAAYGTIDIAYRDSDSTDARVDRFAHIERYQPWGWYLAVEGDVSTVREDVAHSLADIERTLRETLPGVRVVQTGYVFVFAGDGRLVVPPPAQAGTLADAATVTEVLPPDQLAALHAAANTHQPVRLDFPGDAAGAMETYVAWFKPLDWLMVSTAPVDEIHAPADKLITHLGLIFGAVMVVSLMLGWTYAAAISRPLQRLTRHAKALPQQDFTQPVEASSVLADLRLGGKAGEAAGKGGDEVARLAEAFGFMEQALRDNIRDLMETTAAKERIQSELTIARDIQIGLLPKIFPPFPERAELDLHALLDSAKEVGGDLFDFFFVDNGRRLVFTVGDVADKGVPAALFMAVSKTLIKSAAEQDWQPAEVLRRTNEWLSVDNPNSMFVTVFLGVLDTQTGHLAFANAGHNKPVMLRVGGPDFLEGRSGPALGVMEGLDYLPMETSLAPGEAIYVYTDGVTEAMDLNGGEYGDERLFAVLKDCGPETSAKTVLAATFADVRRHAGEADQSDDITMLCLRWRGPSHADEAGTETGAAVDART